MRVLDKEARLGAACNQCNLHGAAAVASDRAPFEPLAPNPAP